MSGHQVEETKQQVAQIFNHGGNGDILMIRKKNNKRKKNRKKNKTKQNGQIRADTEVVSTTLDLTSGRFPARKTKTVRCVATE